MQANASPPLSTRVPTLFDGYSRALMLRTAVFLLRHHAIIMRAMHLDAQAVAYLEQGADAVEQHLAELDGVSLPSVVPALFEGFSLALVLHTGAFLLEHHAITMRGLQLDPLAIAYLEEAAVAVEQRMDEQDARFPDLLDHAVLEILRSVVIPCSTNM